MWYNDVLIKILFLMLIIIDKVCVLMKGGGGGFFDYFLNIVFIFLIFFIFVKFEDYWSKDIFFLYVYNIYFFVNVIDYILMM